MIYFSNIKKIAELVEYYNNIVVVSGSNDAELTTASKITKILKAKSISIPSGEAAKELKIVEYLWNLFAKFNVDRESLVISVGGGAISDCVGFAASTYHRGVDFASVPTTLLAMCDAAIGGKRAINIATGKNLVGSFYDAKFVLIDESLAETLNEIDYKSGLCECLKVHFISGKTIPKDFIKSSVEIKQEIVDEDYYDITGSRIILNYGHTLAHALEKQYKIPHGLAVGVGMDFAASINGAVFLKQRDIFKEYNLLGDILDIKKNINDVDALMRYISQDKKMNNFVMLKDFGNVEISKMNMEKIQHYLLKYIKCDS